jgi:hypothetical protein
MTTYCYTLDLDGDEVQMIQDALDRMIMFPAQGKNWNSTAQKVRTRLYANIEQASGSSANPINLNAGPYPAAEPQVDDQLEIWKHNPPND